VPRHIDDIFEYLRHCGGKDDLVFDDAVAANNARAFIIDTLDSQGLDLLEQPEILVFDNILSIRLRKELRRESLAQVAAASR
jgi:hypothetical protein